MSPGVVADPAAERLYLMNPQGGIDAIGLASGNLLWTSRAAGEPLAVFDDRLAAQADPTGGSHSLPIVLIDTKNGHVVSNIAVPMPPGVMPPSIDDRMGTSSSVEARVVPAPPSSFLSFDGLIVSWAIVSRAMRPIPGPEKIQNYSGAALISLHTNSVTTLASDQAASRVRDQTAAGASRLSGTEGLYYPPQPAGGYFVSVKLGPSTAGAPAVLKRWSADGTALPDIDLGPGFVGSSISADKSLFLAVSRRPGTGAGYVWSVYTIASGQREAELRGPDSAARSFFVWHSILICRTEGLQGLDLKTGAEIWKRALRETSYRGSYPSSPRTF